MQKKMELIHEIHALQAVPISRQPRIVDFTSTAGYGYLSEMSVAEVHYMYCCYSLIELLFNPLTPTVAIWVRL